MHGKLLLATLTGLATISIATPALAEISLPCGWYLEGNLGRAHIQEDLPGSSTTDRFGWGVNVGYKFMPLFAAEIGYLKYPDTTIKDQFGTTAATDQRYAYDIVGKGIIPVMVTGIEAFAKAGIGRSNSRIKIDNSVAAANLGISSGSKTKTGLLLGLGLQYNIMPALGINAQWTRVDANRNDSEQDFYSIGLAYIFE